MSTPHTQAVSDNVFFQNGHHINIYLSYFLIILVSYLYINSGPKPLFLINGLDKTVSILDQRMCY